MTDDTYWMRKALGQLHDGIRLGQSPFGCVIVKNGRMLSAGHNMVVRWTDATAHAEIVAIRRACKKLKSHKLKGCIVYTTCEPCPMCFSAIHWAGAEKIVFGATIADAHKLGFSELTISARHMKSEGGSTLRIKGGVLKGECREAMREWKQNKDRVVY